MYETKRRETLITILSALQNPSNPTGNVVSIVAAINAAAAANSSKLIPASLEHLITYKYQSEIFNYIPINYCLSKAKQAELCIIYPSLLRLDFK
jgi:hypothetical protein